MAWRGGLVLELKMIVQLPSRIIKYYTLNIIQKIPRNILTKVVKHLHIENYKTLMIKIKQNTSQ